MHEWDSATGKRKLPQYALQKEKIHKPVKHKGSLRNAVRKHKKSGMTSPFYARKHKTYEA